MSQTAIRVLCVDDHPLVRKGIHAILANEPDILLVAEASTGAEALQQFRAHRPEVTLMDLQLPDTNGSEVTRIIRQEAPEARIIALTSYGRDQDIYRALEAGMRGYLLKEALHTEVVRAIRSVHAGRRMISRAVSERLSESFPQISLTSREVQVLSFVAQGLGNKEIADRLGTADGTIKMHIQNIRSKLGAADRAHAVTIAIQRGILQL